jgi:ribonuclease HI
VSRPSEPHEEVVVWTDGGARGNPGPAGYGAVVTTPGGRVLAEVAEGIGWATNNVAEYRGVIAGLRRAKELGARRVRVRTDSLLVVNQQKGLWKVKNATLRALSDETARLARGFERVVWEHVPRERNRRADTLANRAMDDQGRVEGPGGLRGAGLASQINGTGPIQGTLDRQLPDS